MYDVNKIKPLPNGFRDWIEENLPPEPIFYKNHRKTSDLLCGSCGQKSTVYLDSEEDIFEIGWPKPARYDEATCPLCGHRGYYETGNVTAEHCGTQYFTLIQQDADRNLCVRIFSADWAWRKGVEANHVSKEFERYILTPGKVIKFKREWKYSSNDYELTECVNGHFTFMQRSTLYDGIDGYDLAAEVKGSNLGYYDYRLYEPCFDRYYNYDFAFEYVQGLCIFANAPWTEGFLKMGWLKPVKDTMWKDGSTKYINKRAKTLKRQLRLKSGENIRLFREIMEKYPDRWQRSLELLQLSEKEKNRYSFEELELLNQHYNIEDVKFMLRFMTVKQLLHRIDEYHAADPDKRSEYSIFVEYRDYLKLRIELGYDMTNEVYIHPKNIVAKHQALIEEKKMRTEKSRAETMNRKYKAMAALYERLCKRYCWEEGDYIIRPAKEASELIKESHALHHCVGSSETYMSKHAEQKSYILFLRKKDTPDKPFCTIEISGAKDHHNAEPKILQWYEAYDKKPDEAVLQPLIDRYVRDLKETLMGKGRKRATI